MKNKILFCGELPRRDNQTGSATVNLEIISRLVKKDFEIAVLSPIFNNEEILDLGFPVNFLKTKYFRSKGFGDILGRISFWGQVSKFLKDKNFEPDLIHIDANPYLCRIKPETPKVLFLHGSEKAGRLNPLRLIKSPYSTICSLAGIHYERLAFYDKNIRRIFINSRYSKNVVVSQYKLGRETADKISAVKLGFNTGRFGKTEMSGADAKKIIFDKFNIQNNKINLFLLFVGGVAIHKGQRELIDSMAVLTKEFPDVGLLIAGKDAGDMDNCREAITSHNLNNNVFLLGSVDDRDLGIIFKGTDIYASAAMEGFGINQVEAMAMGLPLVARDKGAVSELFENGKQGFLANNRNDFIEKLKLLIKDGSLRTAMGEKAKKHSYKKFSWDKLGEAISDSYSEILGSR
ncbi:MAG: glycosyltransferase family 4 protein [Candidatus Wolfebacteria bacterium]|nr:glycosyltransferase family 4 protein [Candidatus Wolfebacteria bacterium]